MGDSREPNRAPPAVFFVSYAGADIAWAEWIAWQLEAAGHKTILQAWDFRAGAHFVDEMHRATQGTRTIAVLSQAYLDFAFAAEEWQAAWASDPVGRAGRLLVVRVEECDRPGLLRQVVSVDVFGTTSEVAKSRLLAAAANLRAKPPTEPRFPPPRSDGETLPAFPSKPTWSPGATPVVRCVSSLIVRRLSISIRSICCRGRDYRRQGP